MSNTSKISDKLSELEELLAWFEQDDLDIEEALAKYEKGQALAGDIKKRLGEVENKITVLEKRFDQASE